MAWISDRGTRPGELVCGRIHLQFLDVRLMNSEAKSCCRIQPVEDWATGPFLEK